MIVKIFALLGILAACSEGVTIDGVGFTGRKSTEEYYILHGATGENTFTVNVTAQAEDVKHEITVSVYTLKGGDPVVDPQTFTPTNAGDKKTFTLALKTLDVPKKTSYVDLEARAIITDPDTKAVTKPYKLFVLNVKQGSVPTYKVQVSPYPACSSSLDITSPSTYPELRAKCGVWLENKTGPKEGAFAANSALVYDSKDKNSKWKRKVEDTVQLSLKEDTFVLKPIGGEKDQSKKNKFIKCEFSYDYKDGRKPSPYITDFKEEIKLETSGDLCGPNPFDKLYNAKHNKHVIPKNQEKGASCYLKHDEIPNILSNYKCEDKNAKKQTISTFCNHETYNNYKYSIDQETLKPWNEAEGLSFITDCLDTPKTLKEVEVAFKGPFNFYVTSEPLQNVSCSFSVNSTEVGTETVKATMIIRNNGAEPPLSEETVEVEGKDKEIIFVQGKEHTLKDTDIKDEQLKLTCEVKLGAYNSFVKGEETPVPIIQVHHEPDYTRVHVDSEKCEVNIKKISRSYTKPALRAVCGIWTANSNETYEHGEWLEGEGVIFNSTNDDWNSTTWNNDEEFVQYYLENKTISIDKMSSDDINWFKCTFEALNPETNDPMGKFSEVVQRVVSHNMADECGKNPLESIDVSKYNVKLIYNEEVTSCFSGNVKVHPSITAKCKATANFYSVNCKDKAYVINDGNKKENYSDEKMKKLLEKGCNAGTVLLVSNSLLAALAAVVFFKSS